MTDHAQQEQWIEADLPDRPGWPKVIGVLSIVYAALGLTCGGIGAVWGAIAPGMFESQLNGDPMPDGMVMGATDYAIIGIGLGLAALLLFAGILAVSYRPQTRIMHLVYAAGSIPVTIWSYLNQVGKQESIAEWAKQYPDNPIAQSMSPDAPGAAVGQLIGLVILIIFGFGVPALYLIWFGLVKTKPEQVTGGEEGVY